MTATAHDLGGTAASTGRLPSVASGFVEFLWPLYLTLVLTLGAWVVVPSVVLGWEPVTIISGSMAPVVQPGHVVVVEPYDGQELRAGDVVTYRDGQVDRLVTHRIASVGKDGTLVTRGDANAVDDPMPLTRDRIVGLGRLVVPAAGLPALWAHQGRGEMLLGLVVLTALAASGAAGAASTSMRNRRSSPQRSLGASRSRRTWAAAIVVLVVLGGLAATSVTRASFVGAQSNPANSFSAGTLITPSGLAATAACTLVNTTPWITLTWSAVPGASEYRVLRAEGGTGSFTYLKTVQSTSTIDAGLAHNRRYDYRIEAVRDSWVSGPSDASGATTPGLLLCR